MYLHTFIYMGPTDALQNLFWLLIRLGIQHLKEVKQWSQQIMRVYRSYLHMLFLKHLALQEYEQETPLKNSKLNSNMSCTCIH